MNKINRLLNYKPLIPVIWGLVVFIMAIILKLSDVDVPLVGDESYYAKTNLFQDFKNLILNTFGHPPGWNLYLNTLLELFPYSTKLVHTIALITNALILSLCITVFVSNKYGYGLTTFLLTVVFSNNYLLNAFTLYHPVISMSLLGILSLFYLTKGDFLKYALFSAIAVSFRESALVFPFACILIYRNLKVIKYSLPAIGIIGFSYFWYYFLTDQLMLSSQVRLALSNNGSLLKFEWKHILDFYWSVINSMPALVYLIPTTILLGIVKKINRKTFFFSPYFKTMALVFLAHSLFFALYMDNALRNTFLSSISLAFLSIIFIKDNYLWKKNSLHLFIIIFTLINVKFIFRELYNENSTINLHKKSAVAISGIGTFLQTIRLECTECDILTTNPINSYLNNPLLGYVKQGTNIRWHGGVKGYTQIKKPDYLVIPMNTLYNFATREMKEHLKLHDHKLVYEVGSQGSTLYHIYKIKYQ